VRPLSADDMPPVVIRAGGAVALTWSKDPKGNVCARHTCFSVVLEAKPDGRYFWQVFEDGKDSAVGTGIVTNLGAAKTKAAQFIARSDKA
jgi:hypothetical protein